LLKQEFMKEYSNVIDCNKVNWKDAALSELKDKGVAVLRSVESEKTIDIINERVQKVLENPSVLGSVGYFQKDPYKLMYDGFLLGKEVVNLIANEDVINLIE